MATSSQFPGSPSVYPYQLHISQKYLDLTTRKLQMSRIPRDTITPLASDDPGVSKAALEPLIDFWQDRYDWRAQESFYNNAMPQYRVHINRTKIHFVHQKSALQTGVPLLFIHGYPESFIAASKIISALTNPLTAQPIADAVAPGFHVVVPSIPGFGFSDPLPETANNLVATAEVFDTLMRGLGYQRYIAHGTGWGFKVCRVLALLHSASCLGIHTANPEFPGPMPTFGNGPSANHILTPAMFHASLARETPPQPAPMLYLLGSEKPQTMAYGLCDSPVGLLAHVMEAVGPIPMSSPAQTPRSIRPSFTMIRSSDSPQSDTTPSPSPASTSSSPSSSSSSSSSSKSSSPSSLLTQRSSSRLPPFRGTQRQQSDTDNSIVWNPTALINWTMFYWLPGPETALRWLANSTKVDPSLWLGFCTVPLGISHFEVEGNVPGPTEATVRTHLAWAYTYQHVIMVRKRDGRGRFPAWETPAELVIDLREFAQMLDLRLLSVSGPSTPMGSDR